MPRRIDNFTSYFHRKKRDLYFVTFTQVKKDPMGFPAVQDYEAIPGRRELLKWIQENLPDTKVGPIFAHDSDSGFISMPMTARSIWNLRPKTWRNSNAVGKRPTAIRSIPVGSATSIPSLNTWKGTAAASRLRKNISTEIQHHAKTFRQDIHTKAIISAGTA